MLNFIPVFGWLFSVFLAAIAAVPAWLIWTHLGFGAHYGSFLPPEWQSITYGGFVGLFVFASIVRAVCWPTLPVTKEA